MYHDKEIWHDKKMFNIKRLVGSTMVKRNITVKHSDEKYSFTKACKLFIDVARGLVSNKNQV